MLIPLLLVVLIATGIGWLLGQPLAGFIVGVLLALLGLLAESGHTGL